MRRSNKQTDEQQAWEIVDSGLYGVVSMTDPEGNPYGVPVNLWRMENDLYFHSAMEGKKTDCLLKNPAVSICCVSQAQVIPEKMTTRYASAILEGEAEPVDAPEDKLRAVLALCAKYRVPMVRQEKGFSSCMPQTAIWRLKIRKITGKSCI